MEQKRHKNVANLTRIVFLWISEIRDVRAVGSHRLAVVVVSRASCMRGPGTENTARAALNGTDGGFVGAIGPAGPGAGARNASAARRAALEARDLAEGALAG